MFNLIRTVTKNNLARGFSQNLKLNDRWAAAATKEMKGKPVDSLIRETNE